ncbi:MAG: HD domain-containing protein [Chromatiales bacterium]|jgi:PAS domain-containing protein|nr:HD domain-containing protein [Chromatiales bacterium]
MNRSTRNAVAGALGVLLLLAAAGALLIDAFIDRERDRDLREWENRLGLAAEARADAVARLLAGQRRSLEELAANASLQVYLGQLLPAAAAGGPAEPMELGYLRNLLVATADREGWTDAGGPAVAASLPRTRLAGLALLAADGRAVVATEGLVALLPALREVAAALGDRPLAVLRETPDGALVLVHAVPVGAVLGADAGGGGRRIGVLVGVRRPESELYPLLTRGPAFAEDSEALLLEGRDGGVLFLSPTRDGSDALHRTTPLVRPRLAEAAALGSPGGFVSLENYRGRPVLQASRPVRGQPWVVAQQVDADQALALADERRGFLLLSLALLLATVLGLSVAAWRHGSSVRAREQAAMAQAQAGRLQRQTELLHAVTDNIGMPTLLLDRSRIVRFNNRAFAAATGTAIAAVNGQPLASVLPPAAAGVLLGLADAGGDAGRPQLRALDLGTGPRQFQVAAVPVPALGAERDLVLLVLEDVTELEAVRRRHDDLLRDLVTALVRAIDRHDPAAGEHATRVAAVADALARELGLGDADRENLDLAATLANVGKVALPAALLAKAEPLTDAERALLRSHVQQSLDLLQGLPFEGPVLEVIAQKQEHLDGSGYPRGLSGDELTLPGRILAVANAFVALVSPRPWRAGLPIRAAVAELMRAADSRYDRRVLAALNHVVENRRDWSRWEATPAD